eukprot:29541-Pelagococcus_subviridis.AAC.2
MNFGGRGDEVEVAQVRSRLGQPATSSSTRTTREGRGAEARIDPERALAAPSFEGSSIATCLSSPGGPSPRRVASRARRRAEGPARTSRSRPSSARPTPRVSAIASHPPTTAVRSPPAPATASARAPSSRRARRPSPPARPSSARARRRDRTRDCDAAPSASSTARACP